MDLNQILDSAAMLSSPEAADPAFVVSTELVLDQPVVEAVLTATAHGIYEARIDDRPVSEHIFAPGWTTYQSRLQVQQYDVTTQLTGDRHRISIEVGNGWWRGDLGFRDAAANYGTDIGVIAALSLTFADGTTREIVTGDDWQVTASRTTFNTWYDGQHLDLRLEPGDPRTPRIVEVDHSTFVPQVDAGVRRQGTIAPVQIWTSPSGKTLVDFGQNLVGWIRLTTPADPGREIVLRHAEVLEDGELGTRPLRAAKATDQIICSDVATVVEPSFTFHGFRYAEVTGWPGELTASDLEAVVVHSELRRTGWFRCSDDRVNQLEHNVVWGLKGNFVDIPTDCPQRDERLGWTGDIAAFAPAATGLFDVSDFLHKWLLDLRAELDIRGHVPVIVPNVWSMFSFGDVEIGGVKVGATAVWGDAAVWVPSTLWERYGDTDRLAAHFPGMVGHVASVEAALSESGLWDTGFQYADWLDPDAPADAPGDAKADKGVVATACAYRSASATAEAARTLGEAEVATWADALAVRLKDAFNQHYVNEDGTIRSDCATVYALAICFDLLSDEDRVRAGARLAQVVREADHRISTGFAGTPFVTWALTDLGHVEDAYALLLQTECPSWLYPVTMGATTIWERWDSMLPDGSINSGAMTSFNHYALGAVSDWLHQVVGGIRPAAPGYAAIDYRPVPGPGLTWAEATTDTPVGRAATRWQIADGTLTVQLVVPDAPAQLTMPDGSVHELTPGEHTFTQAWTA